MTRQQSPVDHLSRRALLRGAAGLGLAAAAGTLLPACSSKDAGQGVLQAAGTTPGAEPPPETTTIRMANIFPNTCTAPLSVAAPFLREEGFTDIRYSKMPFPATFDALPAGQLDLQLGYAASHLLRIDAGAPTVLLAGVHVGCWKVFAGAGISSLRELKGKTVGVVQGSGVDGVFLATTLANVGIDLHKDVTVVNYVQAEAADLLSSGRVDGLVAFPPISQDLQARGIGTVVLDSVVDRPWSSYFCCMVAVNRDWMKLHPAATKRALRAVLRSTDSVAAHPDHAAHVMVEKGFTDRLKYARKTMHEIPYSVWRQFDPADTVRFQALRMKEAGLIKSTPAQILERGTDFSYLAELKHELGG